MQTIALVIIFPAHCDRGFIIYSGLDLTTGDLYAIYEWKIDMSIHHELTHYQTKITSIEQEFIYLSKLKHINIVKYINMKSFYEKDHLILYILQEFILGSNCNSLFIKETIPADVDMLRYIVTGVLNALDFLHRNNVVHKDLRDSCVYLDNNGNVKLSGYSLEMKLVELFSPKLNHNESYSKKNDVLKFGLLVLSLYKGTVVESESELPASLPSDLQDFLTQYVPRRDLLINTNLFSRSCLAKNEKRWNTIQLLKHPFVNTPIYRLSPKRTFKQTKITDVPSPSHNSGTDIKIFTQNRSGGPSRIQNEFEILQWLGKGAFGDVLKV